MHDHPPQAIDQLIDALGGADNIVHLNHCLTRLRIVLHDPQRARPADIEALPMVERCFSQAGQLQVVIGLEVAEYYQAVQARLSQQSTKVKPPSPAKFSLVSRLLSYIADIFYPLLPALISGGLLLGFRNVIGDIPLIDGKTLTQLSPVWQTIYDLLWLPGEAIFMFLPVAICWSTVTKLGGTPILGIILGITLVSPQLMDANQLGQQIPEYWHLGWFNLQKVGYQAQVIPSILAGLALAFIERHLTRWVPLALRLVLVPVTSLLLAIPLAHAIIGPIGRVMGDGVAYLVGLALTGGFAPIGSALFGFLYAPLVITGIHQTTLAIDMQMIQNLGGTPVWPLIALSNIAQASAVTAILLAHGTKQRDVALPAAIAAYLGVTEPAMYGINLKFRYPMLCAMTGAASAGFYAGYHGILANSIGVGGLPGILSIQPQFWLHFSIAMLIAIALPLGLTLLVARWLGMKAARA